MSTLDLLSLLIAVYGAIVASILAARELLRERRKVKIFLDHVAWYERAQLSVTNVGHRPITLVGIALAIAVGDEASPYFEEVRRGDIFALDLPKDPLPFTLADGEQIALPLSQPVSDQLIANRMRARLTLFDAEGRKYEDFAARILDAKWGGYLKVD